MKVDKESPEELAKLEKTLKEDVEYTPIKSPVNRLNYFWKDKEGNELSYAEFMERWKTGMEGVTQVQQLGMQIWSLRIMLIGILCGFVIALIGYKNLWWLAIILFAAFFNTVIQYLGVWQKKRIFEKLEGGELLDGKLENSSDNLHNHSSA